MNDFFNSRKWRQFLKESKVDEACGDMPTAVIDRGPVHHGLEKDHEGEMARSQLMGASESAAALMDSRSPLKPQRCVGIKAIQKRS